MLVKFLNYIFFCYLLFFGCSAVDPNLKVAPIFSDHMVLQQQSDVRIWGSGSPGNNIEIVSSWGEISKTKISENGKWHVFIKTPKYGGPYIVKVISEKKEIIFNDVMIGEVWLTSGQSNMEWPMQARILNQKQEIKNANFSNIRMFSVPRNLNGTNINKAIWKVATPDNVIDFSAVGYFFAREIHQKLNVPVGILNSSWGGTRVEAWTSIEKLKNIPSSSENAKQIIARGGLQGIKLNEEKINSLSRKKNEKFLNEKSFDIPESINQWNELNIEDNNYLNPQFDDSKWDTFDSNSYNKKIFKFESIFKKKSFAEDGVIWLRKSFYVENPKLDYFFIAEKGIDDFDYTYINGKLIGRGFSCCTSRSYTIPKNLLKKGKNIIAIRILDTGGEGAFKGPVYLEELNGSKINLNTGFWRFKHIAFYLPSSIQKHNLSFKDLQNNNNLVKNIDKGVSTQNPNTYSILYNTMIKPISPYKIKGFLWYQGEENVSNYYDYKSLFIGMIQDWRNKWDENLPFYFVQIAPYSYTTEALSQELRDAQRKSLEIEKTGMAITLDIGEENDIHPANKQDVGKRLARLALNNDYGMKEVLASGPLYKSKKLYKNHIDLTFDYVGSGLVSNGFLNGFEIAGSDNDFYPASAKIINEKVRVYSKKVKMPKRVRYGWKNYFDATLFNTEGLPASSFQTE